MEKRWSLRVCVFLILSAARAGTIEQLDADPLNGKITLVPDGFVITSADSAAKVKVDAAAIFRAQFADPLPAETFTPGALLVNGSRVAGAFGSLATPTVTFPKRNLTIPGGEIAWIIYQPFAAELAAKAPTAKTGALLEGGDFFEGTIKAADSDSAKLLNPIFGPRLFEAKRKDILALLIRDPRRTAAPWEVRTLDGSLFGVDGFAVEKTGLALKGALFEGVKIEAKELVEIRTGPGRFQWLTALKLVRAIPVPGRTPAQSFAVEKTLAGEPLTPLGAARGHGIEALAGAALTWEVPAGFNTFNAKVVVPASVPAVNRMIFAVYADERPITRTAQLASNDKPATLRANIGNARTITLRIEIGFPTNGAGSGLWLDPALLRK